MFKNLKPTLLKLKLVEKRISTKKYNISKYKNINVTR